MAGQWYPSQVSAGHEKTPEVKTSKALPLESAVANGKAVHIRPYKQKIILGFVKPPAFPLR